MRDGRRLTERRGGEERSERERGGSVYIYVCEREGQRGRERSEEAKEKRRGHNKANSLKAPG